MNLMRNHFIVNLLHSGVQFQEQRLLAIFEEDECAVTVTTARYREMLSSFILPKLEEINLGDV